MLLALPMWAVDAEVLCKCADCLLNDSARLWLLGGRAAFVDIKLSVELLEERRSKLQSAIGSNVAR